MVDFEEKEFLMQAAPEIYFQIPHYEGYPAVLARLDAISAEELRDRIERTWRAHATKKMLDEFVAG